MWQSGAGVFPQFSCLSIYFNPTTAPRSMRLPALLPHLHAMSRIGPARPDQLLPPLAALVYEVREAEWPEVTITRTVWSLPQRVRTPWWAAVRRLGVELRRRPLWPYARELAASYSSPAPPTA